jgi:hypothetical protein
MDLVEGGDWGFGDKDWGQFTISRKDAVNSEL